MSKVKITVDSTCDLSKELIEKNDITVIPLYVVLGDTSLRDGVEISPDMIYDYVSNNNALPKTSACPLDDYISYFKKFTDEGYDVIHFNISSSMSSSHQNAVIAAGEVGNVRVVDTANISTGSGLLVLDAVDMIKEGKSADEIFEAVKARISKVRASFVVDNLEYLKMGGRCSSVALLGANLLKIKPRIEVKDGSMGVADKYRGQYAKVLVQYAKDVLTKEKINTKRVFVTHTKCDEQIVSSVIEEVKNTLSFDEIYETTAGCVVTSHCGPNTLGVIFEIE